MAHPSAKSLPEFPAFPQPKTLIFKWPDQTAWLLEIVDGQRKSSAVKISDAAEALSWCETHHATFWYQPAPDPKSN